MSVRDKIANLEDIIVGSLFCSPELALTQNLDLKYFTRWKTVVHAIVKLSGRGIVPDIFNISDETGINLGILGELQTHNPGATANFPYYLKTLKGHVNDLEMFERLRTGMKAIADGKPSVGVLGAIVTESLRIFAEQDDRKYSSR